MTHSDTNHGLTDIFQRLIERLSTQNPIFVAQLQRGIQHEEVEDQLSGFPYQLPDEVVTLYGLHNGQRGEAPQVFIKKALFDGWDFLSLEEALEAYQLRIDINDAVAENDEPPTWDPRWWPLFKSDGSYLIVQCETTPQLSSAVYEFGSHPPEIIFAYDSVEKLLETVTAAYEAGLYRPESADYIHEEPHRVAPLYLQYNPQRTAWWLATVPGANTIEDLVEALSLADGTNDGKATARKAAVALRELLDPHTVSPLIQTLQSPHSETRLHGASLLGDLGDRRAVEPLIAALQDPSASVRGAAASSLGQLGDQRAVAPLIAVLGDSSPGVRDDSARALELLGT